MALQIVLLVAVTLIPALELRASIPYGILGNESLGITPGLMSWPLVSIVCVAANIVLGWGVFWILSPILRALEHWDWFRRRLEPIILHTQRRLRPYVDKYGEWGVALFIGIPLPGSGVYTGAFGAFLLGLDRRRFAVANVIGVLIAGTAVTVVSLLIRRGLEMPWLDWIIKTAGH